MDFCKCGSLKVEGVCSNKRNCIRAAGYRELITYNQDLEIRRVCLILGYNEEEYIKKNMSKKKASEVIAKLHKEL